MRKFFFERLHDVENAKPFPRFANLRFEFFLGVPLAPNGIENICEDPRYRTVRSIPTICLVGGDS